MKISEINQRFRYLLTCIMLTSFLFGCKDTGSKITIYDGLPESTYVTEFKSALENKRPVVVSFTAEWCPHCRHYKPTFSEVKESFVGKASFINIDVDDENGSTISNRFQVKGIPTTAFVRADGSVFKVQVGGIEKDNLTELANELIENKKRKRGEPLAPFPIEPQEEPKDIKDTVDSEEADKPQDLIDEEEDKTDDETDKAPEEVKPEESPVGRLDDVDKTKEESYGEVKDPEAETIQPEENSEDIQE